MDNALVLTQLALQLATQVQSALGVLNRASAEGRSVTDAEVDAALAAYSATRQAHLDAIAKAKAEGR